MRRDSASIITFCPPPSVPRPSRFTLSVSLSSKIPALIAKIPYAYGWKAAVRCAYTIASCSASSIFCLFSQRVCMSPISLLLADDNSTLLRMLKRFLEDAYRDEIVVVGMAAEGRRRWRIPRRCDRRSFSWTWPCPAGVALRAPRACEA